MRKAALLLSLLLSAVALTSCSWRGIPLDSDHFPDPNLYMWVRTCDMNQNGYLSDKEIEDAKSLIVWDDCEDLTGIEYLTNLEILALQHGSDLTGIEKLTKLKTLCISSFDDLNGVKFPDSLEKFEIYTSVFKDKLVFGNDNKVIDILFKDCVFEKGIQFESDQVQKVDFDDCGVAEDVVFADCDGMTYFHAYFASRNSDYGYLREQSYTVDLSGCDELDNVNIENGQVVSSVDLSNCGKLREFWVADLFEPAATAIDISGCPNIEEARISRSVSRLDISDCPHLISASEQTPDRNLHVEYKSEDGYIYSSNEDLVLVK